MRIALDTVYATVGKKPTLFRLLVEAVISGHNEAGPAEERDFVGAIRAEPDAARKLQIYAAAARSISAETRSLLSGASCRRVPGCRSKGTRGGDFTTSGQEHAFAGPGSGHDRTAARRSLPVDGGSRHLEHEFARILPVVSDHQLIKRYGQPICQETGVTVGQQLYESVLTFQTGRLQARCSLKNGQLVRHQIIVPLGTYIRPEIVEEFKKTYSDTWTELSGRPGLPPELFLFVSGNKQIAIEVRPDAGIAITLADYFPTPAWLGRVNPQSPPHRAPSTAAQIGANIALASQEPISDIDLPRFMRPENNTTVEGTTQALGIGMWRSALILGFGRR